MTRSHPMPIELDEIDAVIALSLRNGRDSNPRYPCGYARFQVQRPGPADPADLTSSTTNPADLAGKDGSSGMDGVETCPSRAHSIVDAGLVLAAYQSARMTRAFREGVRR